MKGSFFIKLASRPPCLKAFLAVAALALLSGCTIEVGVTATMVPLTLMLDISTSSTPSYSGSANIIVAGIFPGDTVRIYTDPTCQRPAVASAVATALTVKVPVFGIPPGNVTFYANRTDSTGKPYPCSSYNLNYSHVSMFQRIPAAIKTGTSIPNTSPSLMAINSRGRAFFPVSSNGFGLAYTDDFINYQFKDISDGLPDSNVSQILIDSNDVVYVSCSTGIAVSVDYGLSYFTRNASNGLVGSASISFMQLDKYGRLFVGSNGSGLAVSTDQGATFKTMTMTNGLGSNNAYAVAIANPNTLYVGTDSGLSISTDGGNTFTNKTTVNGLLSNYIEQIQIGSDGAIYINNNNGFSVSTNGGNSFSNYTSSNSALLSDEVFTVQAVPSGGVVITGINFSTFTFETQFVTGDGTIYSATNGVPAGEPIQYAQVIGNQIYLLVEGIGLAVSSDGLNYTSITSANGLPVGVNPSFIYQSGPNLYVGFYLGLAYSNNGGTTFSTLTITTTVPPPLSTTSVLRVYVDNSDNIYAGTSSSGVWISTDGGNTFNAKNTTNGLGSNYINGIYYDAPRSKLIVSTSGGIAYSTNGGTTFTNATTANGLWNNQCYGGMANSTGEIFVAGDYAGMTNSTNGGNSYTWNAYYLDGVPTPYVQDLWIDPSDRIFIVGYYSAVFYPGGVAVSTNAGGSFTTVNAGLPSTNAYRVRGDFSGNGKIYVSTDSGLAVTSDLGNTYTNFTTANGLGTNRTNGVYADIKGNLFVGTNGGLSVSSNGGTTFTTYGTSYGLGSNNVNDIYEDSKGNVYVGTNAGFYKYLGPKQ